MNIEYEVIRVRRLVRQAIKRKLPLANAEKAAETTPSEDGSSVILYVSTGPNAETAKTELARYAYTARTLEEVGLGRRLAVTRRDSGSQPDAILPPQGGPAEVEQMTLGAL